MNSMIIGVADDEESVLEAYEAAIKKLGHVPATRKSIRRMMELLRDPNESVDILFLDHHFHGEESGVSMITEIKLLRPDLDIVITTKQPLEPNFVQEIVTAGVGFFKKSVIDPIWLEMEISQRVNVREAKLASIRRNISQFVDRISATKEGIWRFPFFSREKKLTSARVANVEQLSAQYIFPKFQHFLTLHSGQAKEITEEGSWEETVEMKAATTEELGLKFSDSAQFLASKIGGEIVTKLKSEHGITEKKILRSAFKSGEKIEIPESEHKAGVRRKEFYRGILHQVFRVILKADCPKCKSGSEIDIFVLVPDKVVEVTAAYNKKGMVLENEDGRKAYSTWPGGLRLTAMCLTDSHSV